MSAFKFMMLFNVIHWSRNSKEPSACPSRRLWKSDLWTWLKYFKQFIRESYILIEAEPLSECPLVVTTDHVITDVVIKVDRDRDCLWVCTTTYGSIPTMHPFLLILKLLIRQSNKEWRGIQYFSRTNVFCSCRKNGWNNGKSCAHDGPFQKVNMDVALPRGLLRYSRRKGSTRNTKLTFISSRLLKRLFETASSPQR